MIEVIGDILTPAKDPERRGTIVCHQVNCQGVMGAGLAKQIRTAFPQVFDVYVEKCFSANSAEELLGEVQFCSALNSSGFIIANIFGQNGYGRNGVYTNYDALRKAFETIAKAFPEDTIRIPYKLGCGLAGGDWSIVYSILADAFKNHPNVEIWKFNDTVV